MRSIFAKVDVDQFIHLTDLHLHLVEVLEDIDQLLLGRVVPLSLTLLQFHHQFPQLSVLLQVLAQLVGVLSFTDLARHHFKLVRNVLLLLLQRIKRSQDLFVVAADHLLDLSKVIGDSLVLLTLVQKVERALGQTLEVFVGISESEPVLLDQLPYRLIRFLEIG